jgi:hypothetical protein
LDSIHGKETSLQGRDEGERETTRRKKEKTEEKIWRLISKFRQVLVREKDLDIFVQSDSASSETKQTLARRYSIRSLPLFCGYLMMPDVSRMSMRGMKEELMRLGHRVDGCVERDDIAARLVEARRTATTPIAPPVDSAGAFTYRLPVPESFKCPISGALMVEPVIDPDGHTYDRSNIERWLARNRKSPITRKPLKSEMLTPNRALADSIVAFKPMLELSKEEECDVEEQEAEEEEEEEDDEDLENWESVFVKFKKFWRRIARVAALHAHNTDALVEAEVEYFGHIMDELHSAHWDIKKPIERILSGVREVDLAAFDIDRNSKKQIAKLLEWVREEENKLARTGDNNLFDVTTVTTGSGCGAVDKALKQYDRICQILAWLTIDAASEKRDKMRQTVVDKLGPFLNKRHINILSAAQRLWVLADSEGGLSGLNTDGALQIQLQGINPLASEESGSQAQSTKIEMMSIKDMKEEVIRLGGNAKGCVERTDIQARLLEARAAHGGNAGETEMQVMRELVRHVHEYLSAGSEGLARKRARHNLRVLEVLAMPAEEWNPTRNLGIKQAQKHHLMWERMAHLTLAPDLAALSRHRMCPGGVEAEREAIFGLVLPRMEACGWSIKVPFLRFWEGERSKEALMRGLSDKNDIQLVSYVYDTYFAPLINRTSDGVISLDKQVEEFAKSRSDILTRITQLTSDKTYHNGIMRFEGVGISGERQTVLATFLPTIEQAGYAITPKIVLIWGGERDPETLFEGLDEKTRLLMQHVLQLLQQEEGVDLSSDDDNSQIPELPSCFEAEAATVAYLARVLPLNDGVDVIERQRQAHRMSFLLGKIITPMCGYGECESKVLCEVIDLIYQGERGKDVLLSRVSGAMARGKKLDFRSFILHVIQLLESEDVASLMAASKKDHSLKMTVWTRPNYEEFFDRNASTFRRIVQLCDKSCSEKFFSDRLFPGGVYREREVVMSEFVQTWTRFNWHLVDAINKMWSGQQNFSALCQDMTGGDVGSRYCVFRMLELYSEMGITSEQAQAPETLPSDGHPVSSTATVADAVEAKLAEKLAVMTVKELKQLAEDQHIVLRHCLEKGEMVDALAKAHASTRASRVGSLWCVSLGLVLRNTAGGVQVSGILSHGPSSVEKHDMLISIGGKGVSTAEAAMLCLEESKGEMLVEFSRGGGRVKEIVSISWISKDKSVSQSDSGMEAIAEKPLLFEIERDDDDELDSALGVSTQMSTGTALVKSTKGKLSTLTTPAGDQDKDKDEEELDAALRMWKSDHAVPDAKMEGLPKRIQDLTVQQVSLWLEAMELGDYVQVFRSNLIDGEVLTELDEKDLIEDFGMHNKFHRRLLAMCMSLAEAKAREGEEEISHLCSQGA